MKSKNILRGLMIVLIAIACIIIFPNAVSATEPTYTRRIAGNDGSIELTINGLTLDTSKQYQFALTTEAGATATTTWHTIANTEASTAVINLSAGITDIRDVLKEKDEGYIYIKASDATDGTYALNKFAVNLKLPYLQTINYEKVSGWYQVNQLYGSIGQGNNTLSKGTYYQFKKITDRNIIQTYLQNKDNITALESLIGEYPRDGYTQNGHINATGYTDGLYVLWIEQVGKDADKTIHGAIIHDGKPTATTVDEYLGTSASPSPNPSTSPDPDNSKWTAGSKFKYEIKKDSGRFATYNLNITGGDSDGRYKVFASNGKAPQITYKSDGTVNDEGSYSVGIPFNISSYFAKPGDVYVTIVQTIYENGKYESREITAPQKIDRPELNKLGSRMHAYFFNDSTSLFLDEPILSGSDAKINIKIGKITDKSILRSIKNKETDCLTKLRDYAKNAKSMYEGKMQSLNGQSQASIAKDLDLVHEEYYYVYFTTDEGYYFVEDVSLYQALVGEAVGKNLHDYLSDEFKWNLGDDPAPTPTSDGTTMNGKLPQTGEKVMTAIIVVIVAGAGVIFYIKSKEYKI